MSVSEQTYRRGRGGQQLRPFVEGAEIRCREYSQPLQRVLTDFGAEESFGRSVERLKEHYGIEVPSGAVRQITERHAELMLAEQQVLTELSEPGSQSQLIGEMDGSMVPLVAVREDAIGDRRQTRTVSWQEARLALARVPGAVTARYGATMGTVRQAGDQLADCVIRLGGGSKTKIHCVGDGASWIAEQVERCFGTQGKYLIDFYHVSQYLAAAAESIAPTKARHWLHRQQTNLKTNRLKPVLKSLAEHLEPAQRATAETPVRACYRYLSNRAQSLNYRQALKEGLPIGSGEIESAHRSVVQKRLKLAGAWWKKENAEKMIALRIRRANNEWQSYWQRYCQSEAQI
ncbi:MAG: UPF0236 family transposase-like protein [Arenimonas sp.]